MPRRFPLVHNLNLFRPWRALARSHRLAPAVVFTTAGVAVLGLAGAIWFAAGLVRDLPDAAELGRIGEMREATTVFDAHDSLAFTIFKEQRIEVPLDEVSPHLISAITAVEDQRFFQHHGFNPVRMGYALLANLRHGRVTQGGSTITQQLARLSFLTREKTMRRKMQELILARRIERKFSKDDILRLYLNKVYFGDGLYGVEAAARGYFAKHARDVSVAEAALLAGLVKSPSNYAPTQHLERAVARRNVVLGLMKSTAAIDEQGWKAARAEAVTLRDGLRADEATGLYFQEQVRQELVSRFGWERVHEGGLRVFTTVDVPMQRAAERSVGEGLKAVESRRRALPAARARHAGTPTEAPLQAALIALDPRTGHVRAMVGGRDFNESRFNRAVQARRQPGSAFKPFVYAAALEAGYTPATLIRNLNVPIDTLEGAWTPEDEHADASEMTLRTALRTSSNRAAVRLLQEVGLRPAVRAAKNLGMGDVPSVPSLALGSGDVTLQSLTAAYAAFANAGNAQRPLFIRRVEDRDGTVLYVADEAPTRAISATTAYLLSSMMADVINAGTAARARGLGFTLPAAGKTGTTNDYKDAWFVGFTPNLVAGVWVGFDQPRTIMPRGFASEIAVPLWAHFMKDATMGDKPTWLPMPSGIVSARICRLSGALATEHCLHAQPSDQASRVVYTEYFAQGTEPKSYCDRHNPPSLLAAVGRLLTGGTPVAVKVDIPAAPPPIAHRADGVAATSSPAAIAPTPKKKRGFWSRVFGRGDRANERTTDR